MSSPTDELRPAVDVAVGIVVENGRLLICRRPDTAVLGGQWEFPGGKLEAGETPAAAAVRELKEELGITVEATATLDPLDHDYPHARIHLTPVLCRLIVGRPEARQVAAWAWVRPEALADYAFPVANAPLLHRLMTLPLQNRAATDKVIPVRAISSAG